MKKVLFFIFAVTLCVAISSCRDDNFDWDKAHSVGKEVESAYEEHFKEIFGEVSPTQSWDFTQQDAATRAGSLAAPSKFGGYNGDSRLGSDSWYDVPTDVTTWLDKNLKEQVNNSSKGYPLAFSVPSNGEFDLIPVYQGMAYSYWHMNMGIKAKDGTSSKVKFWEKNQDIQICANNLDYNRYGGVFTLQNKKDNGNTLYLRAANAGNCIVVRSGAKKNEAWDNQFFIRCNDSFLWYNEFIFEADVRADKKATISTQIHGAPGEYKGQGNIGDITFDTEWKHVYITSWGNLFSNIGVSGQTIAFQLNDFEDANNYYFKNISFKTTIKKEEKIINSDLTGSDMSSFYQKVNYGPDSGKTIPCEISRSFILVDKSWNTGNYLTEANPYDQTGEHGVRYTVVAVKDKKYLFAFYERPSKGMFVTVDSNGNLGLVKSAEEALEAKCYYANMYYDDYLMLGDYLVYVDSENKLQTKRFNNRYKSGEYAHYPWEASEEVLAFMNDVRNGYKWSYHTTNGYRFEDYEIFGSTNQDYKSEFKDGVQSLAMKYGSKDTKLWKPVRADFEEMSMEDNRNGYKKTRSKGYHFSGLTPGDMVYFEWEVMAPYYRRQSNPILSSLSDQMRIIKYDGSALSGIPSGKVVSIVGCEAGVLDQLKNDDPSKEPDYNDMVFLLITDEEPEIIDLENSEEVVEKRYMVEDLGASDDIDFNDMVVDLRQVKTYKVTRNLKDNTTNKELLSTKQEVILRAMGGTLDFDFKIGDKVIFTKSKLSGINYKTMYKTGMNGGKSTLLNDYDCELYRATLNGNPWEPSTNNVSFTVYKEGTSTANNDVEIDNNGSYNITFPNIGDAAPRIIAFPVTKLWRDERHECCNEWLYDREPALWEMPENAPDANKNTHTESFSNWISSHRSEYLNWVETKFSTKVKNSMDSWLNKKNVVVEQ